MAEAPGWPPPASEEALQQAAPAAPPAALPPEPGPKPHQPGADAGEEDVWWGGYASRTMLPHVAIGFLLTLLLAGLGFWLRSLGLPATSVRYGFYALAGLLWLVELGVWLHRATAVSYRLTTRTLYRDRGFFFPVFEAVELATVGQVAVRQSWFERRLNIGRVRVGGTERGQRLMELQGVSAPKRLAAAIRRQKRELRGEPARQAPGPAVPG